MKHTPEPWEIYGRYGDHGRIVGEGDRHIAGTMGYSSNIRSGEVRAENQANARRIVECVNACAGIEDPETVIPQLIESARLTCQALIFAGRGGYGAELRMILAKVKR